MRRSALTCSLLLSAAALAGCSPTGAPTLQDGPVGRTHDAIAYGQADGTHTAVVALLADAGGGSFTECSGTIVQFKNSEAYILTAAHCCNMGTPPSIVVLSNDYTVGEQYLGGNPQPPAYPVVANSVYYDSLYDQQHYDFCMLRASGMPANTAVIPVAQPGQDGLALGVLVQHVGFGVTDNNANNSVRRNGVDTVDQNITSTVIQYSQGGPQQIPGPCEGDSGGPALMPVGAPQAQQKVVATTSYGNSASCSQGTIGVSMRVTSETGPSGFITNFLNDTPSGTQAGMAVSDCNTCAQTSQNGPCKSQAQTCANDQNCLDLNNCLQPCQTQACVTACENQAGPLAVNELTALDDCICNVACPSQCSAECSGGSTSTGGMMACGIQAQDATCNSCLVASCCNEGLACAADSSCVNCLKSANPPAVCNNDSAFAGLFQCLDNNCAVACGGGSSTSSTSSGTTTTTTTTSGTGTTSGGPSGTGATTGSGTGATSGAGVGGGGSGNGAGNGSAAGGNGNTGGNNPGETGGCSVGRAGSDPASGGPLAALLFAAALALSRRRRAS
jgi:hypothetical protein